MARRIRPCTTTTSSTSSRWRRAGTVPALVDPENPEVGYTVADVRDGTHARALAADRPDHRGRERRHRQVAAGRGQCCNQAEQLSTLDATRCDRYGRGVTADPTQTDPDRYKVIFENDRVRVLEYKDKPGDRTSPHRHPDSVMYTLSSFERRLIRGDQHRDVQLQAGRVNWLSAQEHSGENIGTSDSHVIFVELREPPPDSSGGSAELGPTQGS